MLERLSSCSATHCWKENLWQNVTWASQWKSKKTFSSWSFKDQGQWALIIKPHLCWHPRKTESFEAVDFCVALSPVISITVNFGKLKGKAISKSLPHRKHLLITQKLKKDLKEIQLCVAQALGFCTASVACKVPEALVPLLTNCLLCKLILLFWTGELFTMNSKVFKRS